MPNLSVGGVNDSSSSFKFIKLLTSMYMTFLSVESHDCLPDVAELRDRMRVASHEVNWEELKSWASVQAGLFDSAYYYKLDNPCGYMDSGFRRPIPLHTTH